MKKLADTLLGDFLALIFPEFCACCNESLLKGETQICTKCRYDLPITNYHLHRQNILSQRFWGKLPIEYAFAYLKFTKGGKVQKILHDLKYNGNQEIGIMLGKWYGQILVDAGLAKLDANEVAKEQVFQVILPIPLHKAKLRKRGFNQSDCFAEGLSSTMGIPWHSDALKRNKATKTQTRKGRMERWQNVENIFEVTSHEVIEDKHVLLVDDVVTTGSTLEACAQAILNAGAAKISIATLAVAV
ncbi:competence protein [marine bacterium AO1-C]|nr:competence protein [marine bacterium AO1-C]